VTEYISTRYWYYWWRYWSL